MKFKRNIVLSIFFGQTLKKKKNNNQTFLKKKIGNSL